MTVIEDPNAARILARWLDESRWYPGDEEYPGDPEISDENKWSLLRSYFNQDFDDHARKVRGEERDPNAPEPVTALEALTLDRLLAEMLQKSRWYLIYEARKAGYSWDRIGQALNVTRQTAHKVYADDLEAKAEWWRGRCGAEHFAKNRPEYESVLADNPTEK